MKLFVYGTLIPTALKANGLIVRVYGFTRIYSGYAGGLPYPLAMGKIDSYIGGVVMDVEDIAVYDKYENGLFIRVGVLVIDVDGNKIEAEMYVVNTPLEMWANEKLDGFDTYRLIIHEMLVFTFKHTLQQLIDDQTFTLEEIRWLLM